MILDAEDYILKPIQAAAIRLERTCQLFLM